MSLVLVIKFARRRELIPVVATLVTKVEPLKVVYKIANELEFLLTYLSFNLTRLS